MASVHPPRWLRALIRISLPRDERDTLLDELDELHVERASRSGRSAANRWYARQAAGFVLRLGHELPRNLIRETDLGSDLRAAGRVFRKRPSYAFTFALTLALGTGVLATVYAAAHWVLLRPVPAVRAPEELVLLRLGGDGVPAFVNFDVSNPDFLTLRERLPGSLAAHNAVEVDLAGTNGINPRRVGAEIVTANYFTLLGTALLAGRAFGADHDVPVSGLREVVISARLAESLFRDNPAAAVGTTLQLNSRPVRVIGVAARGFQGAEVPGRAEVWFPLSAIDVVDPSMTIATVQDRGSGMWRRMILRPSHPLNAVAIAAAANSLMEAIRKEYRPNSFMANMLKFRAFDGAGLDPMVRADVRRTFTLLSVTALLLLLLATANLMNLAIIQATVRLPATAIRFALGGGRLRVGRVTLIEMLLLGGAGAVGAAVIAMLWTRWFQPVQLSEHGGALGGMRFDVNAFGVTLCMALFATAVAFMGPARLIGRTTPADALRRMRGTAGTTRLRSTLVGVQVALSVMLLVCAGLMARTVGNLRHIDLGFNPDRLLTFAIDPALHGEKAAGLDRLASRLGDELRQIPGVRGVAFITPAPLGSSYITASLYASADSGTQPVVGAGYYVSPEFFSTMGVNTIAGDRNWRGDSATVVITRATALALAPNVAPSEMVGRFLPRRERGGNPVRVAAIVEDVQLSDVTSEPPPAIFYPLRATRLGMSITGVMATGGNPSGMVVPVQRAVSGILNDLPVFEMRSARAAVDLQFAERITMARTATTLGAIGLLLAGIGLYGVLNAMITARRREIGIRAALGAGRNRLVRLVLSHAAFPVALGAAAGTLSAFLGSKVLASQLYQLERLDPASYAWSVTALLIAGALAAAVPTWRAIRLPPAEVLRDE